MRRIIALRFLHQFNRTKVARAACNVFIQITGIFTSFTDDDHDMEAAVTQLLYLTLKFRKYGTGRKNRHGKTIQQLDRHGNAASTGKCD
jgi:hypothetical protein